MVGVWWEGQGPGQAELFLGTCGCLLRGEQKCRLSDSRSGPSFPPLDNLPDGCPYKVIASEPYLLLQNLGPAGVPAWKLRRELPSKS